jgi:hypothetical protein
MTTAKSFKRLVRARMAKTGESYTAARAMLLAADRPEPSEERPALPAPDASIRKRTGRGWEEWFALLDGWGAAGLPHRDIARRVAAELGIDPLAWNAQAITAGFERARGLRAPGERDDGFAATASRTVGVPVERLFAAMTGDDAGGRLRPRGATPPRRARYDWEDGPGRVLMTFAAKGDGRSTVSVEHRRLPGAAEADRMRVFWRERLAAVKARLESA